MQTGGTYRRFLTAAHRPAQLADTPASAEHDLRNTTSSDGGHGFVDLDAALDAIWSNAAATAAPRSSILKTRLTLPSRPLEGSGPLRLTAHSR